MNGEANCLGVHARVRLKRRDQWPPSEIPDISRFSPLSLRQGTSTQIRSRCSSRTDRAATPRPLAPAPRRGPQRCGRARARLGGGQWRGTRSRGRSLCRLTCRPFAELSGSRLCASSRTPPCACAGGRRWRRWGSRRWSCVRRRGASTRPAYRPCGSSQCSCMHSRAPVRPNSACIPSKAPRRRQSPSEGGGRGRRGDGIDRGCSPLSQVALKTDGHSGLSGLTRPRSGLGARTARGSAPDR
mmetsp:Transcript_28450/g.70158  ORF Transcript_28450/g.70158 Transcript_28450/m.70158 type:complete len:242 (+) Transcript_28450:63-788(+)